jgi:CRISPR-associated protein Cmr5
MCTTDRAARSTTPPRLTLEQRRAANAWRCAHGQGKDYVNLAKGLPALIMNSGLLQVMAFLNEKGSKGSRQEHCATLGTHLRAWLHERFGDDVPDEFPEFMEALMKADSRKFQALTTESLAWLRWLRQMAAAVVEER